MLLGPLFCSERCRNHREPKRLPRQQEFGLPCIRVRETLIYFSRLDLGSSETAPFFTAFLEEGLSLASVLSFRRLMVLSSFQEPIGKKERGGTTHFRVVSGEFTDIGKL